MASRWPFYAAAAAGIACTGGGAFSLDALLGLRFFAQPYMLGGLLVLTLVGAILTLAMRQQAQPQTTATQSGVHGREVDEF